MNERFPQHDLPSGHQGYGADLEASREQQSQINPRIYVTRGLPLRAELTDGTWLDMARDPRVIYAEMFAVLGNEETEIYDADRLYIFDHHGFGDFDVTTGAIGLEGVDSIELLSQVARGIKEHGPAFAAWAKHCQASDNPPKALDRFPNAYKGRFESIDAYVRHLFEPLGIEDRLRQAVPAPLEEFVFVDYAAISEEMLRENDLVAMPAEGGGIWLFDNRS